MRRWNLLAAVAAVCLALTSPFAIAQAPEKPKLQIGVGGKSLFYYLPLTIAEQKGYFKAEGLDVEVLDFPGGAYRAVTLRTYDAAKNNGRFGGSMGATPATSIHL